MRDNKVGRPTSVENKQMKELDKFLCLGSTNG